MPCKDVLIDFAITNSVICDGKSHDLIDIFNAHSKYNLFIVSHPGSYVGIRKALVLTIVQQYASNINIYILNVLQYLRTFDIHAACIVRKHIWYADAVYPLSAASELDIRVCNEPLTTCNKCKVVDVSPNILWANRYQIFTKCSDIVYPVYVDVFSI